MSSAFSRSHVAFDRSYRLLDHPFRIRSDLLRVGILLDRYLARFRSAEHSQGPTYMLTHRAGAYPYVLYKGGRRVQSAPDYTDLLDYVLATVHQDALEGTDRFIAVHAAAASVNGTGFAFPAPMDSGKTTLVAGLVDAGFGYLSDEAALFDATTGWLHPFPKVLWMEAASIRELPGLQRKLPAEYRNLSRPRSYVRPGDLRPGATAGPCRLGFVIAPRYRKGDRTRLEPVSRAEALMTLAQNAFNFRRFGGSGLAALGKALRGARCYRLSMGDLDSAVRAVMEVSEDSSTH